MVKATRITSTERLNYYILVPSFGLIIVIAVLIYLWRKHKNSVARRIPLLQSTPPPTPPIIDKPIQMHEIISRGQFGCVWKALYEHKIVAVKVILPHERYSWEAERKIYSDYKVKHQNVLGFHSAEKRCEVGMMQYWIITEYHEYGSLADYLRTAVLGYNSMMKLTLSMVRGLMYLHTEDLRVTPTKPVIVHRDFKSRNVLIKSDLTCCIGDFGSACAFPAGSENEEAKAQVRYNFLYFQLFLTVVLLDLDTGGSHFFSYIASLVLEKVLRCIHNSLFKGLS